MGLGAGVAAPLVARQAAPASNLVTQHEWPAVLPRP